MAPSSISQMTGRSAHGLMAAHAASKPPSLTEPQSIVTISVGDGSATPSQIKTYIIHKELLCYWSPIFAAAFNNQNFVEGETQSMDLVDVDRKNFGLLVNWVYKETIPDHLSTPKLLAQLWTLADRFFIASLQPDAFEKLISGFPNLPTKPTLELITWLSGH